MFDLRIAARSLSKRPGFAVAAIMSLALGMSLVTVAFSVLKSVFATRLPFNQPDELVVLSLRTDKLNAGASGATTTLGARYIIAAEAARALDGIGVLATDREVVGSNGDALEYSGARVTPGFFGVLNVRPLSGRLFTPEEGAGASGGPVIISEGLWRTRFGSSKQVVGRTMLVGGTPRVVVGVVRADQAFPPNTEVWTLLPVDSVRSYAGDPTASFLTIGRLRPGVSTAGATAELTGLFKRAAQAAGQGQGLRAVLGSLDSLEPRPARDIVVLWGLAAFVIVLLSAVNFATMMLARGMQRRSELAVRSACGASFGQLVALSLQEAGVLAVCGGVVALGLSEEAMRLARAAIAQPATSALLRVDGPVAIFALVGTVALGVIVAIAPAVQVTTAQLGSSLAGGNVRSTLTDKDRSGRRGLVALQVGLATMSVAVVTAVVRAEIGNATASPGYDAANIVTGVLQAGDDSTWSEAGLVAMLRARHGVADVAVVRTHELRAFKLPGAPSGIEPHWYWSDVSADFFATLRPRVIAGHLPSAREWNDGDPKAVVSERVLRWLQCDNCDRQQIISEAGTIVGRRLLMKDRSGVEQPLVVVAVVADVLGPPAFSRVEAPVYSVNLTKRLGRDARFFARVHGSRLEAMAEIRRALRSYKLGVSVLDVHMASDDVSRWHARSLSRLGLLLGIAGLALLLALVGVYGLAAHFAEERMREIGIRLALGARKSHILGMVVREIWWVGAVGLAFGLVVAARLIATVNAVLVNPFAPMPIVSLPLGSALTAGFALVLLTLVATIVPARRALRMDISRVVSD